jgi:hypothetical protein
MRRVAWIGAVAVLVALPGIARAQKAGACNFNGSATLNPPIGSQPQVCTSASGCQQFQFTGSLSGPACGGLSGSVSTQSGLFFGPYACEGNIHGGVANTPVGTVTYRGVCAGAVCAGVGFQTAPGGAFEYTLIFDQATINRALNDCPNNKFTQAVFSGAAAGGSR